MRLWVEIAIEFSLLLISSVSLFVRLWVEISTEQELKVHPCVSLFVRLWVEIPLKVSYPLWYLPSASSWGCELKYDPTCWTFNLFPRQPLREAVSWNTDCPIYPWVSVRQPLREAVSWNYLCFSTKQYFEIVSLFVRLWVEIRYFRYSSTVKSGQPLREAVSWNRL